jgi:hypothetical protein
MYTPAAHRMPQAHQSSQLLQLPSLILQLQLPNETCWFREHWRLQRVLPQSLHSQSAVKLSFFLHCNFLIQTAQCLCVSIYLLTVNILHTDCQYIITVYIHSLSIYTDCKYILTRLSHLFFCSTYHTSLSTVNNKARLHGSHVYSTTHRTKRSAVMSEGVRGVRFAGREVITISISLLQYYEGYTRVALWKVMYIAGDTDPQGPPDLHDFETKTQNMRFLYFPFSPWNTAKHVSDMISPHCGDIAVQNFYPVPGTWVLLSVVPWAKLQGASWFFLSCKEKARV